MLPSLSTKTIRVLVPPMSIPSATGLPMRNPGAIYLGLRTCRKQVDYPEAHVGAFGQSRVVVLKTTAQSARRGRPAPGQAGRETLQEGRLAATRSAIVYFFW